MKRVYNEYLKDFRSKIEEIKNSMEDKPKANKKTGNVLIAIPTFENIEFNKFFIETNKSAAERAEKLSVPQELFVLLYFTLLQAFISFFKKDQRTYPRSTSRWST